MWLVLLLFTMTTTISRTVKYLIWQMEWFWIIHFSLRLFEYLCPSTLPCKFHIYIYICHDSCTFFFVKILLKNHWMITVMHWSLKKKKLGDGFTYFFFSPRKLGKIPILTSIFFRWVGEKPPTRKSKVDLQTLLPLTLRSAAQVQLLPLVSLAFPPCGIAGTLAWRGVVVLMEGIGHLCVSVLIAWKKV